MRDEFLSSCLSRRSRRDSKQRRVTTMALGDLDSFLIIQKSLSRFPFFSYSPLQSIANGFVIQAKICATQVMQNLCC
jgi:hypothetical protein